jgi:hypothetical protein
LETGCFRKGFVFLAHTQPRICDKDIINPKGAMYGKSDQETPQHGGIDLWRECVQPEHDEKVSFEESL